VLLISLVITKTGILFFAPSRLIRVCGVSLAHRDYVTILRLNEC
jgi:hypothetical protein